ncbi:hypothetical protein [Neoroseomonas lacus]|uniref:hypothetical protein n=1 Tax=Neoroseomonas lacus TaxID=287609 RepID=UPI001663045D|nr:hypothetical protein [Neoroseomonas lacus]
MLLRAGAAFVGFIVIVVRVLDGSACEPDEAAGCGASVVFLAAFLGLPLGTIFGGIAATRLIQWPQCRAEQATKDQPV